MAGIPVTIVGIAYYTDLSVGGGPIIPGGGQPPSIWPGVPTHPIVLPPVGGGSPPGIWGGGNEPFPTPPIYIQIPPGSIDGAHPEHPIYIPVFPAHPIIIPPDAISPGVPAHPIYLPPGIWGPNDPRPTPPIFIPPDAISPGVPTHPIYLPPVIWPGPGPLPHPEHPITLPPGGPGTPPGGTPPDGGVSGPSWKWVWSPSQGWHPGYVPEGGKPKPPPIAGGGGETPPTDPNAPTVNPL